MGAKVILKWVSLVKERKNPGLCENRLSRGSPIKYTKGTPIQQLFSLTVVFVFFGNEDQHLADGDIFFPGTTVQVLEPLNWTLRIKKKAK